ncbi:MAG TPA: ABC-F family ATP-binding cassette domain-containing protein [Candidatus Limnocylindrales bacterium]
MAILRLSNVRREVGTFVIIDSVNAAIAHDERIGLVGANGAGKTTLLRIAVGLEPVDSGEVQRKNGLRVGLLTQEANLDQSFVSAPSLRAAVRSGAGELEQMERRLSELESAGAAAVESAEYAHLREAFDHRGGYTLDLRVEAALSGLGFDRTDWDRPPTQMSGGQQTRAALARLLVAELDLLMLDEPTNHLDLSAIEWLEQALAARPGALLVASHDRAFLDGSVDRIWEIRDRRLTVFRGNYSAYAGQREERDARARKDVDTRAEAIDRERDLVQRYRSHRKFSKMHEHEARLEALQADAEAAPQRRKQGVLALDSVIRGGHTRSGDVVVRVEQLVAGYPGKPVVRVERLEARRGARIGLVGPNGAGKTTLLRTIAGQLAPLDGWLELGHGVQVGYLAQIRAQAMPGATVLDTLTSGAAMDSGPARSYLARFLFRGDDVFKQVELLSGGERSRLELALVGLQSANLLLLDEPTNHLDIPAREALEAFLREAAGTVIVVSHDRRLLEAVCNELWVVDDAKPGEASRMARFPGRFIEWRGALADGWSVAGALDRSTTDERAPRAAARPAGRPNLAEPKPGKPARPAPLSKDAYRRRRQVVEDDLTRLGLRKSQLELALGDPKVQANFVELRRVTSELADVNAALAQAEDAWLVLTEQAPR